MSRKILDKFKREFTLVPSTEGIDLKCVKCKEVVANSRVIKHYTSAIRMAGEHKCVEDE